MRAAALAAAVALTVVPAASSAQSGVVRRIFVRAVNGGGSVLTNLEPQHLEVREDGRRREVTGIVPATGPMRVALVVDSSGAVGPIFNTIRAGLRAFLEALPGTHEIALLSTGGQLRVRQPPTTDRQQLRAAADLFAPDGGANAFLDSLTETNSRFLTLPAGTWPVMVILTTDSGETRWEPNIDRFNRFVHDFAGRGGTAHAIVMHGRAAGITTDFAMNVVENTGGYYESMSIANVLPAKMRELAEYIGANHRALAGWLEVEYRSETNAEAARIAVGLAEEGVQLQMATRRPF